MLFMPLHANRAGAFLTYYILRDNLNHIAKSLIINSLGH